MASCSVTPNEAPATYTDRRLVRRQHGQTSPAAARQQRARTTSWSRGTDRPSRTPAPPPPTSGQSLTLTSAAHRATAPRSSGQPVVLTLGTGQVGAELHRHDELVGRASCTISRQPGPGSVAVTVSYAGNATTRRRRRRASCRSAAAGAAAVAAAAGWRAAAVAARVAAARVAASRRRSGRLSPQLNRPGIASPRLVDRTRPTGRVRRSFRAARPSAPSPATRSTSAAAAARAMRGGVAPAGDRHAAPGVRRRRPAPRGPAGAAARPATGRPRPAGPRRRRGRGRPAPSRRPRRVGPLAHGEEGEPEDGDAVDGPAGPVDARAGSSAAGSRAGGRRADQAAQPGGRGGRRRPSVTRPDHHAHHVEQQHDVEGRAVRLVVHGRHVRLWPVTPGDAR